MFPNIFREFPKFSEDCRRLPRKIRRFFDLISIYFGSFSIGTWQTLQADWSKMISHVWISFLSTPVGYHFSRFATTRYTTAVYIINSVYWWKIAAYFHGHVRYLFWPALYFHIQVKTNDR